jgi:hypothetical protein
VNIISKKYQNKSLNLTTPIDFTNEQNIYLNATKTAKAFGKRLDKWKESPQTLEYIEALESNYHEKGELKLIVSKEGRYGGTWIHKKLVIMFARWLSPDFAVWCDFQIEEILKSQNSQPIQTQTSQDFDIKFYIQQNRDLIELIKLINSENAITLHYLDKLTQKLNLKSPLDLLEIDLNLLYFIPTELGKFLNKSAVEINKILEAKGFQEKIDGVWVLTEQGEKFAIRLDNNFHTIKWKLESLI